MFIRFLLVFFFIVLTALKAQASENDDDKYTCKNSVAVCDMEQLCDVATFKSNGKATWNGRHTKHIIEAKARGYSCGVTEPFEKGKMDTVKVNAKQNTSTDKDCSIDPRVCDEVNLCSLATYYVAGKRRWYRKGSSAFSYYEKFVNEAKERGYSCDVYKKVVITEKLNAEPKKSDEGISKAEISTKNLKIDKSKRVALLVGNDKYQTSPLKNPTNDIKLLERTLKSTGFEVIKANNVNRAQFRKALDQFKAKLEQYGEDTNALFYYSGHGMQYEGKNYLIPLKSELEDPYLLEEETISSNRIYAAMRPIKSGARIILLDACRDNKFKSFVRSGTRGLAEMRAITGTIIGYATGPGEVALDGRGNNSPFAEALAETIKVPNLDIEQVLKKARIMVRDGTNNRQTPWASSSLTGDFYFVRN